MRLIHTADWQLGLRLNFVGGDAAVRLRTQRFDTVRRIGALARERNADLVVVAGDVFDDNGVGADTLQQARDALTAFSDVPVVLLPGNHDPATPDSALRRLKGLRDNVHVALEREVLRFGDVEVYPCPLTRRHEHGDPAAWLPERDRADTIRIALAHGGAHGFGERTETPNRIDVNAILDRGFDYVALGDWHGLYQVNEKAWYSGAPEATRFKESRPGHVLEVEIDGPGAAPRVESMPVARTRWRTETHELHNDGDLERLAARLEQLEEKSWTLVELSLRGALSLDARLRLDALLDDFTERLALLRISQDQVRAELSAEDNAALTGEGYLGRAIDVLRDSADPVDADALKLLYRLMKETA